MQYLLLRLLAGFFKVMPQSALHHMANTLGALFWQCAPTRRTVAIEAVSRHLCLPEAEARRIARQSFAENFLSFLEIFHTGKYDAAESTRIVCTPETWTQLKEEQSPIVTATGHIGSWEFIAALQIPPIAHRERMVVVRSHKNPALDRLMIVLRSAQGMAVIDRRNASPLVVPKLRAGGLCGFLVDHNTAEREAVFLPFLEDTAAVTRGPADIALRVKAAVYPVFLLRDGKGGHILHIFPPLRTSELTGSIHERTRAIAAFYTDAVAAIVRQYPEQWLWMHKRWKTRETIAPNTLVQTEQQGPAERGQIGPQGTP